MQVQYFLDKKKLSEDRFNRIKLNIENSDYEFFEALFFARRSIYQKLFFSEWVDLNPITDFGKKLKHFSDAAKLIFFLRLKIKKKARNITGLFRLFCALTLTPPVIEGSATTR